MNATPLRRSGVWGRVFQGRAKQGCFARACKRFPDRRVAARIVAGQDARSEVWYHQMSDEQRGPGAFRAATLRGQGHFPQGFVAAPLCSVTTLRSPRLALRKNGPGRGDRGTVCRPCPHGWVHGVPERPSPRRRSAYYHADPFMNNAARARNP